MGCNPVQFIIWLLVLIFISFIVAFFCAPLYVIVHCLTGFISPLSDIGDLLLKGSQFPRYCVDKMMAPRCGTLVPRVEELSPKDFFYICPPTLASDMRNVEIKASVQDWKTIKSKAKELSGSDATVIEQCDTFFKVPKGRLKLRKFKDGSGELIFYQRPDTTGPKLSDYKKVNLNQEQCQELRELLAESNGVVGTVEKTRFLYVVGQSRVHVDEVLGLGRFVEIEVVLTDDQTIEDGQRISNDLMTKLEIKSADLISKAYLDLLVAKKLDNLNQK